MPGTVLFSSQTLTAESSSSKMCTATYLSTSTHHICGMRPSRSFFLSRTFCRKKTILLPTLCSFAHLHIIFVERGLKRQFSFSHTLNTETIQFLSLTLTRRVLCVLPHTCVRLHTIFAQRDLQDRSLSLTHLMPILCSFPHCNNTTTHCTTMQHTALQCNTLHYTATHCTTLQSCSFLAHLLPSPLRQRCVLAHTCVRLHIICAERD